MSRVSIHLIPRKEIYKRWPLLYRGVVKYTEKTPHKIASPNEILLSWMSPEGDELIIIMLDGKTYAGFVSFKILEIEDETWGTFAMIYADEEASRNVSILEEAMPLAKEMFKQRGCTHMNYLTARKGFARLAPRLGFRSRIIEWVTEVD